MKINWKLRIFNKSFWITLVPAVLLLIQAVAAVFGYTLDLTSLGEKILTLINAAFAVMVILGIANDPTTHGLSDSKQALTYKEPNKGDQ